MKKILQYLPHFLQDFFGTDGDEEQHKNLAYKGMNGDPRYKFPFMDNFCRSCKKYDEEALLVQDYVGVFVPDQEDGEVKIRYFGKEAILCQICIGKYNSRFQPREPNFIEIADDIYL